MHVLRYMRKREKEKQEQVEENTINRTHATLNRTHTLIYFIYLHRLSSPVLIRLSLSLSIFPHLFFSFFFFLFYTKSFP